MIFHLVIQINFQPAKLKKDNFLLQLYLQSEFNIAKKYEYVIDDIKNNLNAVESTRNVFREQVKQTALSISLLENVTNFKSSDKPYEQAKYFLEILVNPIKQIMISLDSKDGELSFSIGLDIFKAMMDAGDCFSNKNNARCISSVVKFS